MFGLIGLPFYFVSSCLRGGGRRRRRRPSPTFYWHGYCPIHHRRQDTANRCAASAAYRQVERQAIAERTAREAYRAEHPWHQDRAFWVAIGAPVVIVLVLILIHLP